MKLMNFKLIENDFISFIFNLYSFFLHDQHVKLYYHEEEIGLITLIFSPYIQEYFEKVKKIIILL
jgi:hypothetical protein